MTQRIINTGVADKGNGDPLRTAFTKVNDNFTELYNQVAASVVVDATPPETPGEGDLWWDPEGGRLYISYDSTWIDASPVDGAGISSTNELVNGAYTVSLGVDGNLTVPDRITFSDDTWQSTAFIGHAYELRNSPTGNLYVTLDDSGSINTPLLLPLTFTAVLDPAHYIGEGTLVLEGDAWEYTVQFQVGQDGTVQTMIDNQPWPSNPGYINGLVFEFLTSDHGIPGYTFTFTLNSIQNPGPGVYTANPEVSQPPVYPATIQSLGAVKLAANDQSLTFGTNGTITYQGTESDLTFTNQIGMESALIWRGGLGAAINNMETHLVIATNHNNTAVAWQFGHDGETLFPGRLNFSDGSTLGDNILTGAIDSDLGLEIKRIITVSDVAAAGSTTGTLIVDISTNDDITAVLDGWEINAGTGLAPIWMAVTETTVDPGVTYEIVVPEFVFEPGNTYTFRNPVPESKTWFIRNLTGTLVAPGGAILSNETAPLGGGGTYRDFSIELPTPDDLNEKRWTFSNDGNLTLPDGVSNIYSADPNISGGINGIGVVGKDRIYLTITNNDGSYQWDFRDYGLADYSTNRRPAIMFPGNSWIEEDLTNQSLNGGMFGPLLIGSQDKLTLRTNLLDLDNNGITPLATYDWEFGKDGNLTLPPGGTVSYTPAVASDWSSTLPTTIQEALDRIAAKLASQGLTP